MMRCAAFRPSSEKITKLQLHPTYPWLVSADEAGNVVVWDWQHRQVIYEVNALGVDERRLAGAQLQGEAEPKVSKISQVSQAFKDIKGGSVKHVKFYDEDVRHWQGWLARAAISQSVTQEGTPPGGHQPTGPGPAAIRGRHFLVICSDSKATFLDLVSMRAKDVPKLVFDNKAPLCVEFLLRSGLGDGPLAAFGGPDGAIRVLSMQNWLVVQRFAGAHKGPIACLKTFLHVNGETLLLSGGNDGLLTFWSVDNAREVTPKLSVKGHDGGVVGVELIRVQGGPPQLVTIGADKTLAVWNTVDFKEIRRMKPVAKMACTSVTAWSHPRAPNLNILTCAKDSHIWTVEHYGGVTRPLCDLTIMIPPAQLPPGKKLKTYCLAVHPLQPHLVAAGTNFGVILSEFDSKAIPAVVPLPTPVGIKEHRVICNADRELRSLTFQLSSHINPTVISAGDAGARFKAESPTDTPALVVKQSKAPVVPVSNDSAAWLGASHSGKYVSIVWPELPAYEIYRVRDWAVVDHGVAKHFAWDSTKDRYALLQTVATPKMPVPGKHGSSKKAREAAAAHAAALAATAAAAAAAAKVEVRILLEDGSSKLLVKAIEGRGEPVTGLQGGTLLGVAYKFPRRTMANASPNPLNSTGGFIGEEGPTVGGRVIGEAPANFQLYSWETYRPVSQLLPQPEWTAWDQTVEYCALAYQRYIVIAALRPQYRFLGTVAIVSATGGVWHRRQLFISTPTTIECVFVDAGISAVDLERKRKKEEQKANAARARAVSEQGELALLTVDAPQAADGERVTLRPPMLQVVRLASFHSGPSAPPVLNLPKQAPKEGEAPTPAKEPEERRGTEVAIGGGGVSVAVSRLPQEQKRPVGPLVIVGVREGVLWLVDMFMTAHAMALSHPGIRCRCLAAYGDAVSAVKWASRLGREHHDDLAQFLLGMGCAAEALHLPGISKRLEFDLALQSSDLKRALQALITLSNSKGFSQDIELGNDTTGILSVATKQDAKAEAVYGIVKFAQEFLDLIDAADATGQKDIARQALTRLAAAGSAEGGLSSHELRALSFRLATHGELTRLAVQANKMINAGLGHEAALAGAFLGDPNLQEKAWEDTGMFSEATLHAQAHGRQTMKGVLEQWNKVLQKQYVNSASKALPDVGANVDPVLAALEGGQLAPQKDGVLQSLTQPRQPFLQILPPPNVPTSTIKAITGPAAKPGGPTGGPMLALPAPATAPAPGAPPHTAPASGVEQTGAPQEAAKASATSTSDQQATPSANGSASQAPPQQAPEASGTSPDQAQPLPTATTSTVTDSAQVFPTSKSPSANDLPQLSSASPGAVDVSQGSGFPQQAGALPSPSAAASVPRDTRQEALSLPLKSSFNPGFQAFPVQSTQPPSGAGFQGLSQTTSLPPLGPGFQAFPQQSMQPGGPVFQAFDPQAPQPFGSGFQAFQGPYAPPSFGHNFQAFPPAPHQSVDPNFLAFPSTGQPGAPSFQASPLPAPGPQGHHGPQSPAQFAQLGLPPSSPGPVAGPHRSFPPPVSRAGAGAAAQAFPFPMSTSTSVGGGRGFPLPMSTSTSIGGPPSQRGLQSSASDMQLVPTGTPLAQQTPPKVPSAPDLQLVPASSSADAQGDRPFF